MPRDGKGHEGGHEGRSDKLSAQEVLSLNSRDPLKEGGHGD